MSRENVPITLFILVLLLCLPFADYVDRVASNNRTMLHHFIPKPPSDLRSPAHSTPHSMPCCTAGSCARDGHHMTSTHGAFWHADIEPLPNMPEEAGWHIQKAAPDVWPAPVSRACLPIGDEGGSAG